MSEQTLDQFARAAVQQHAIERSDLVTGRFESHDRVISRIHEVARKLVKSSDPPFYLESSKKGEGIVRCKPLGKAFVEALSTNFKQVHADYPLHRFSPVFRALQTLRRHTPLNPDGYLDTPLPSEKAQQLLGFANTGARLLRRRLGRDSLTRAQDNFRRSAQDNFAGLVRGVDWIAQRHAEATVLRFDLHFRKLGTRQAQLNAGPDVTALGEFLSDRERFHRSFDRRFGDKLLGYAWVLEYGRERGFHVHYLLILKYGSQDDHVALVDQLGEKWAELTSGQGGFYSCNANARRYRFRSVGHVRFDDANAVKGLHLLATYMTLASLFVKLDVRPSMKTFGKGRFPKGPVKLRGRPPIREPKVAIRISVREALDAHLRYL